MDRRVLSSLFLVLLSILLPVAWSCKCKAQPPKVSYCNAHWVAHTHINSRQKEQKMPKGIIDRQIFSNLHYRVKHLNVFKMPEEFNNTALPIDIYSAEEDAACGIILEPGHEYLLSGGALTLDEIVEEMSASAVENGDLSDSESMDIEEADLTPISRLDAQRAVAIVRQYVEENRRLVNGTMLTQLCGQILFDDLQKSKLEDVLEWKEVPDTTQKQLQTKAFEPECKGLLAFL